jgi:hypothetical protein
LIFVGDKRRGGGGLEEFAAAHGDYRTLPGPGGGWKGGAR